MGKGQEGRAKPWSRRWAAAAMEAVFAMTGCVQQTDVPIVSEKTKGTPDTSGQTRKEETGQNGTGQNGAEQDGAMKEQAGPIRQLAEVPEIYEAHIEEENITITADVTIEVPETDRIPLMDVRSLPYTEEELEKLQEILKQEIGVGDWVEQSRDDPRTYESSDGVYILSLGAGDRQKPPMFWLMCPGISDGTGGGDDPDDLSGFSVTGDDRKLLQAELEEKAEMLLEKMGLENFCLEDARWRRLSVSEHSSWSMSEQWGVRLYYRRKIGDMEVVNDTGEYSLPGLRTQYVEFLYREDKTLLAVKDIGRESVTDTREYAGFLLPFLAVSQIFEQCMKSSVTDEDMTEMGSHTYLAVTEVKLAYRREFKGQAGSQDGGGRLVPVWAFYGITEKGYQDHVGGEAAIFPIAAGQGKETLLLTINAEDGTIYGK